MNRCYNDTGLTVADYDSPAVFSFKVYYGNYSKSQWRTIEIPSNKSIAELCYAILVSFNVTASHLFNVILEGKDRRDVFEFEDLDRYTLENLYNEKFTVVYDFGCEQEFHCRFVEEKEYTPGPANQYPKITAGKGKGIIDDLSISEYEELVEHIKKGKKKYSYAGIDGIEKPWKPDDYSAEEDNKTIRSYSRKLKWAYEYGNSESDPYED